MLGASVSSFGELQRKMCYRWCVDSLARTRDGKPFASQVQRDSLLVLSFLYTLVASEHEVMQREGLESLARVLQLPGVSYERR
jgi:hypothetical protein